MNVTVIYYLVNSYPAVALVLSISIV